MALIFEDSQKVTRRKAPIPERDRQYYSALYNALQKTAPKNNLKNLKSLASTKKYNKKGADAKMNGDDQNLNYVSVEDAKKRMERMNPNDITQGGQKAYDFYKRTIQRARSQEKVSPVEPPKPTSNAVKPPKMDKPTTIEKPNGTVTIGENKQIIKEHEIYDSKFYEYMEEYGASYVFNEFLKNPEGKQKWTPLINPDMYAKALREFTQYGKLVRFPSRYVYQWMGIIMKNTAMLVANTEIAGHSRSFPFEDFEDFLRSYYKDNRDISVDLNHEVTIEVSPQEIVKMCDDKGIYINEGVDKYGQTYFPWMSQDDIDRTVEHQDYERNRAKFQAEYGDIMQYIVTYNVEKNSKYHTDKIIYDQNSNKFYWNIDMFELLYEIGITNEWMQMPDGSDAYSDFGLEPLYNVILQYDEDLPPEKVLVLVNRALDVYHQRGDMASIFIQGGSKALSAISEEIKRSGKKVYINENQLMKLSYGKHNR